jgi:hypothetical protein
MIVVLYRELRAKSPVGVVAVSAQHVILRSSWRLRLAQQLLLDEWPLHICALMLLVYRAACTVDQLIPMINNRTSSVAINGTSVELRVLLSQVRFSINSMSFCNVWLYQIPRCTVCSTCAHQSTDIPLATGWLPSCTMAQRNKHKRSKR